MSVGVPQAVKLDGLPIWSLHDGQVSCALEVLPDANAAEARRIADRDGFDLDPIMVDVNVFLFHGPLGLTLVDAGTGTARGPHLGHAGAMLGDCGFGCRDIDAVLMTHLHVDHAAGLCNAGAAAYPRATLFVGRAEAAFWAGDMPSGRQISQVEFAREALAAYQDRLRLVDPWEVLATGLTAEPLSGHTPGMTGFRMAFSPRPVLFCGDFSNLPALQLPQPGWAHVFDADPVEAAHTRCNILKRAEREDLIIAGAHLPFPGVGTISARADEYAFHVWSEINKPET